VRTSQKLESRPLVRRVSSIDLRHSLAGIRETSTGGAGGRPAVASLLALVLARSSVARLRSLRSSRWRYTRRAGGSRSHEAKSPLTLNNASRDRTAMRDSNSPLTQASYPEAIEAAMASFATPSVKAFRW
jgi:hypothetical protein